MGPARFRQGGVAALAAGSSRPEGAASDVPGRGGTDPPSPTAARPVGVGHRARGGCAALDGEYLAATARPDPAAGGPAGPVQRYEWPRQGDLLHVDIKPPGRIDGVGHRIEGIAGSPRVGSAGSMATEPLTPTAAWPTWRCSTTSAGPPAPCSCGGP